jgi:hypothetical protein
MFVRAIDHVQFVRLIPISPNYQSQGAMDGAAALSIAKDESWAAFCVSHAQGAVK